jgi:hypothetical protein
MRRAVTIALAVVLTAERRAPAAEVKVLRPERAYELVLIPPSGVPRLLASRRPGTDTVVRSEQAYVIAPDRRWLAYRGSGENLVLRAPDGTERMFAHVDDGELAFSPDGRFLAVAPGRHSYPWRKDVALIALADGVERSLAGLGRFGSMRWSASGLVIFHGLGRYHDYRSEELWQWDWWSVAALLNLPLSYVTDYGPAPAPMVDDVLSLVTPDGGQRLLYRGSLYGFTAAAQSSRVVYFVRNGGIFELDAADQDAEPRRIDDNRGVVESAELSPDGSHLLFAGARPSDWEPQTFLAETRARPRQVAGYCSGLWFARDGQAYACIDGGRLVYGRLGRAGEPAQLADAVESARFTDDGRLIVVRANQVLAWDPERDTRELLWSEKDTRRRIIGADRFAGGLVLWREAPPATRRPRRPGSGRRSRHRQTARCRARRRRTG